MTTVFCILFYGYPANEASPHGVCRQGQRIALYTRKRYPLSPVSEMPSMNVRWAKKKATKMGKVISELTAIR